MEALIARLLSDFENGRMSRRQLVQSLAMAAIAAPFASAAASTNEHLNKLVAPPPSPATTPTAVPYKTVWLDHISFGCTDYKRSADFYTDLMGWQPVAGSDNGRQVILNVGDIGQIIVRNGRGVQNAPAAPGAAAASAPAAGASAANAQRPPVNAVIDHIAFGVSPWDTETVRSELTKRGLSPREDTGGREPIATAKYKSFHVKDPDGWDLQISNASKEHHDLP